MQKSSDAPLMSHPIILTEDAVKMVRQAMEEEGLEADKWLYIGVRGGGCSGLEYVLDFVDAPTYDGWFEDEQFGLKTCTDPISAQHLQGTTIRYMNTLMGSGFRFDNPTAQRKCGCGSSFG